MLKRNRSHQWTHIFRKGLCLLAVLLTSLQIGASELPPPGVLRTIQIAEQGWTPLAIPFLPSFSFADQAFDGQGAVDGFQILLWDAAEQSWQSVSYLPEDGWVGDSVELLPAVPLWIQPVSEVEPGDLVLRMGGLLPEARLRQKLYPGFNVMSSPLFESKRLNRWKWNGSGRRALRNLAVGILYGQQNNILASMRTRFGSLQWTSWEPSGTTRLDPSQAYFLELYSARPFTVRARGAENYDAEILPSIQSVEWDADAASVFLTLATDDVLQNVDIFVKEFSLGASEEAAWDLLFMGLPLGEGTFHEVEDVAPGTSDVRLYQVTDADLDSDADGLSDGMEHLVTGSDPFNADVDLDGLLDGEEYEMGTDMTLADTDQDGMSDGHEVQHGMNPHQADNPAVVFNVFTPLR